MEGKGKLRSILASLEDLDLDESSHDSKTSNTDGTTGTAAGLQQQHGLPDRIRVELHATNVTSAPSKGSWTLSSFTYQAGVTEGICGDPYAVISCRLSSLPNGNSPCSSPDSYRSERSDQSGGDFLRILGSTEVIKRCRHPVWTKYIDVDLKAMDVFWDGRICVTVMNKAVAMNKSRKMGSAIFTLQEVFRKSGKKQCKPMGDSGGSLYCRVSEVPTSSDKGKICLCCRMVLDLGRLPPCSSWIPAAVVAGGGGGGGAVAMNPYLEVEARVRSGGDTGWDYYPVYRSKAKTKTHHALWQPFSVDLQRLCEGNLDNPIRFRIRDDQGKKTNGMHPVIGYVETTVSNVLEREIDASKGFVIQRDGKDVGHLLVTRAVVEGHCATVAADNGTTRSDPNHSSQRAKDESVASSLTSSLTSRTTANLPKSNLQDAGQGYTVQQLYGRENVLQRLHDKLGRPSAKGLCPLVSLLGSSGIGKTHVALRFADDWMNDRQFHGRRFCFWLNASTESTLSASYRTAIERMEGPNDKRQFQSIQELATALCELLHSLPDSTGSSSFQWILIFDSVPGVVNGTLGPQGFERWFLPTDWIRLRNGGILLCAIYDGFHGLTNTNLGTIYGIKMDSSLQRDDALVMVRDCIPNAERHHVERLVSVLGCHPFLIASAALKMKEGLVADIEQYIEEFQKVDGGSLVVVEPTDAMKLSVRSALSYANEQHRVAVREALSVAAYAHPDYLQLSLLGAPKEAVSILLQWGVLRRSSSSSSAAAAAPRTDQGDAGAAAAADCFSIHRLHQEATRQVLGRDPASQNECLDIIFRRILNLIKPFDKDKPNGQTTWHLPMAMTMHVESITDRFPSCHDEKLDRMLADLLLRTAIIVRWTSHRFDCAKSMLKRALDLYHSLESSSGRGDELVGSIARAELWIGRIDKACSKYDGAMGHYDSCLKTIRRFRKMEADVDDEIGRINHNKRCYKDALERFERSLKTRLSLIDTKVKLFIVDAESDVAEHIFLENLRKRGQNARLLLQQQFTGSGDERDAERLERLCSQEGEDMATLLASFKGLSDTCVNMGRVYREAKVGTPGSTSCNSNDSCNLDEIETRALRRLTKGDDENWNLDESLAWFEAALGGQYIALMNQEKRNDTVATTLSHIGRILIMEKFISADPGAEMVNVTSAVGILNESLSMKQEVYGENAVNDSIASALKNVAQADNRLGDLYNDNGKHELAKYHFERALSRYRNVLRMMKKSFSERTHKKIVEICLGMGTVLENLVSKCDENASNLKADLKNLMDVSTSLIAAGDNNFHRKQFQEAADKYNQAEKMLDMVLETDPSQERCRQQATALREKATVLDKLI